METALVIVIGDAEPFDDVRREFAAWDVARGLPFHLTLLWPFAPREELTRSLLEQARSFFAQQEQLEFALTRITSWPDVVYAVPEPGDALVASMHALHERFPQWPPYGGIHEDVVPHATLGHGIDGPAVRDEIERRLASHLPRRCQASDVSLLEEYVPDRWRERERFPLGC